MFNGIFNKTHLLLYAITDRDCATQSLDVRSAARKCSGRDIDGPTGSATGGATETLTTGATKGAITGSDAGGCDEVTRRLMQQIEDAIIGGATIVQLREKALDENMFLAEAIEAAKLCARYDVPLIINDNVDIAVKSGAAGVHVGIEDMPVSKIREKVNAELGSEAANRFIVGATCKTVAQAKAAEEAGADYMGVGAVFPSPTKKNAIAITTGQLNEICSSVNIPAVAIGGINSDNIMRLKGGGMAGVAVVSALFGEDDVRMAAATLRKKAEELIGLG